MIETLTALQEVLERDPRELIGEPETSQLDFKVGPYAIDETMAGHLSAQFELVKGVSAFTARGGAIVLGVETEKDSREQVGHWTELNRYPHNPKGLKLPMPRFRHRVA